MLCQFPQPGKQGLSLATPHEILHYHERGCSVTRGCFGTATATFSNICFFEKQGCDSWKVRSNPRANSKNVRKWNLLASCCLLSHISPCHNSTSQGWAVIPLGLLRDLCWARSSIKRAWGPPSDNIKSSTITWYTFTNVPTISSPKFTLTQSRRFHTNT